MSRSIARILGALFLLVVCAATAPCAEEAAPARLPAVLELLRQKKIITEEEAQSLRGRSEGPAEAAALVELLKAKGVISAEEAAQVSAQSSPGSVGPLLPASQDARFKAQLRERWVKNNNRGRDFDDWFSEVENPEDIISRMQVMGELSPLEAEELQRWYRDHYLTGAISAAMHTKEAEYLERVRKGVAWEVDEKIKEKLKGEWSQRIRLSGDIRLRYQQDLFDEGNGDFLKPENPSQIMNSKADREMLRLRLRLGLDAKVSDEFAVGLGLATGSTSNPVSTNQTLGDSFNKKSITLEKAFLKWSPDQAFTLWGGRFASPWVSSDLVWDGDLNFDGLALQYRSEPSGAWGWFGTAGAFSLQEVELSQRDKWLLGAQAGVIYRRGERLSLKLAAAYYDLLHTVGISNDPARPGANDWTAPQFQQKGNTLMDIDPSAAIKTAYASEFKELNLTGTLDLAFWHPVHVLLNADYVDNLGFDQAEVEERTGSDLKKETVGYQVGLSVGHPKVQQAWEWNAMLAYRYLESDAVMDAFTDSDFHLGGTNAKGWIAGADLGVANNVWLSTKWLTANEIAGPPLAIDVFQFNLNAKF